MIYKCSTSTPKKLGLVGFRTNGPSEYRDVRTNGPSEYRDVTLSNHKKVNQSALALCVCHTKGIKAGFISEVSVRFCNCEAFVKQGLLNTDLYGNIIKSAVNMIKYTY